MCDEKIVYHWEDVGNNDVEAELWRTTGPIEKRRVARRLVPVVRRLEEGEKCEKCEKDEKDEKDCGRDSETQGLIKKMKGMGWL